MKKSKKTPSQGPLALIVKCVVQVFLMETFYAMKDTHPQLTPTPTTLLVYFLFQLLVPYSNYARLNLWQALLTVAFLSLSVAAHLSNTLSAAFYLVPVLIAEYIGLGVLGAVLQTCLPRFSSKLTREKGKDLRGLFVFAFTWGRRAQLGLEHFYVTNQMPRPITTSEQDIVIEIA